MNNLFLKTRINLSAWYLLILMIVSVVFSIIVYTSLNAELLREARREQQKVVAQQMKINLPVPLPDPQNLPPELVNPRLSPQIADTYINARNSLILKIIFSNLLVLGLSATAGYFLAGKTLSPIETMLENQKNFIANASHELRTPLTALKTGIEVTLKIGPIPYERVKSLLESNLEDVEDLEKLSNNLLSLEKLSHGITNNHLKPLQLDLLVENAIERFKPLASKNNIRILQQLKPVVIRGESQSLTELVSIFLDNAIKYNRPNGKVKVCLLKKDKSAIMTFSDTGIGIDKLQIPHIFERFYRGDNSRSKTAASGHGLGLAIASEIVNSYKGKIDVESAINKGSVFTVQFPL